MQFLKSKFRINLILLILSCSSVFAQNFKIKDVKYSITGISKEQFVDQKVHISRKTVFKSKEELEKYIAELRQRYVNLRLFDEINVEYETESEDLSSANSDADDNSEDVTPVVLKVSLQDSNNFVAFPYYKYSSDDGNVFKTKMQNSNFAGTLSPLEGEIYFSFKQNDDTDKFDFKFGGIASYSLPFKIGPIDASWDNEIDLSYTIGKDVPEWDGSTGLSLSLPFEWISYDLVFKQKFLNDFDNDVFDDRLAFGEYVQFAMPVTLKKIYGWGDIKYTPSVSYTYYWKPDGKINIRNDALLSPEILFSNGISANLINWNGNFRKGVEFFIRQDIGYNYHLNDMVIGFEGELKTHFSWDYNGISLRLYGFSYLNKNMPVGIYIRGVRNEKRFPESTLLSDINSTSTPGAVVLNLDFPIHIMNFDFDKIGIHFMNKFNSEIQIVPFIDLALTKNRVTGRDFSIKDGFYTAGIEVIAYPHKFKSLQLRASAGFDMGRILLKDIIDESWRPDVSKYEISLGVGLHY
ncbi:MAG: hypothetical protein IK002_10460 [Treponema sp.]|uniref:hypothetical protein n=1 Tax=Treponema sp. TaxID=166 RepID=UPI00298E596A|nr:hypothetical protein [Treponema sp.]MBR5934397.1 hypothetical protein [Treponema sp.]